MKETLERMVEEEKHHLTWVKRWLDEEDRRRGGGEVSKLMRRFERADAQVYDALCRRFGFRRAA